MVVLVLALLEGVARVVWSDRQAPTTKDGLSMLQGNPYLLFEYAPGVYREHGVEIRINAMGLRGPQPAQSAPDGVRRFLTTGDSSIFGFMVPEAAVFSAVASQQLGEGVEAINGAVPGYSSFQSINLLRMRALQTAPDLVVIGNLWSDNNFDSFVDKDLMATTIAYERSGLGHLAGLLSHSALYRSLDWVLRVERRAEKIQTVSWQVGNPEHIGPRRVEINDYAENLETLVQLAHHHGAEAAFVLLANQEDLDNPTEVNGWDPYRQVMRDTAARHGTPLLDVITLFQASGQSREQLFLDVMHPTVEGHRIMGEALAELLADWAAGMVVEGSGHGGAMPRYTDPLGERNAERGQHTDPSPSRTPDLPPSP